MLCSSQVNPRHLNYCIGPRASLAGPDTVTPVALSEAIMWDQVVGFVGKLMGGSKGPSQIGKDQQAVSGTTSGSNSPIITAGGSVTYGTAAAPGTSQAEREAELFSEMYELMPE